MKHYLSLKFLPIAKRKVLIICAFFGLLLTFMLTIIGPDKVLTNSPYYFSKMFSDPETYLSLGIFIALGFVFAKTAYKQVYDWASYHDLKIISIYAIDIGSKIPGTGKWFKREYLVKVENGDGVQGKLVFWYVHQQLFEPYRKWLSPPLRMENGDAIPEYTPP